MADWCEVVRLARRFIPAGRKFLGSRWDGSLVGGEDNAPSWLRSRRWDIWSAGGRASVTENLRLGRDGRGLRLDVGWLRLQIGLDVDRLPGQIHGGLRGILRLTLSRIPLLQHLH